MELVTVQGYSQTFMLTRAKAQKRFILVRSGAFPSLPPHFLGAFRYNFHQNLLTWAIVIFSCNCPENSNTGCAVCQIDIFTTSLVNNVLSFALTAKKDWLVLLMDSLMFHILT